MGLPTFKPATYEDLSNLPENLVGEIINGRLVTHPRPAPKHAPAYSALGEFRIPTIEATTVRVVGGYSTSPICAPLKCSRTAPGSGCY